jgi:hypothetical protein
MMSITGARGASGAAATDRPFNLASIKLASKISRQKITERGGGLYP